VIATAASSSDALLFVVVLEAGVVGVALHDQVIAAWDRGARIVTTRLRSVPLPTPGGTLLPNVS